MDRLTFYAIIKMLLEGAKMENGRNVQKGNFSLYHHLCNAFKLSFCHE